MASELNNDGYRVLTTLASAKIPFVMQKLITAQAMHESANFTSPLYKRSNNTFGMTIPSVRKSPYIKGIGGTKPANEAPGNYASYLSLEDSVKDVLHLYEFNKINYDAITTPAQFARWLKQKSFYEANEAAYAAALDKWLVTMKDVLEPVIVSSKKKIGKVACACKYCGSINLIDLFHN